MLERQAYRPVTAAVHAATRHGSASPASPAAAPPAAPPETWPAAHAALIRPAARPWGSPDSLAASLSIVIAGVKQKPAPIEIATRSATTRPSAFAAGSSAIPAARTAIPRTYGRVRPTRSESLPT